MQVGDLYFYLKIHYPQTLFPHLTSKNQPTGFSTNEALELVKMCQDNLHKKHNLDIACNDSLLASIFLHRFWKFQCHLHFSFH